MKKSQLRKIIRESIRGSMTEQTTPLCVSISTCWRSRPANWEDAYMAGNPNVTNYTVSNNAMGHTKKFLINGQQPQLGDVFMGPTGFTSAYGAWGIVQQQGGYPMPPGYHMYQPCIVRHVWNHSNCGSWTINQVLSTGNPWDPPIHNVTSGNPHPACPAEPLPPTLESWDCEQIGDHPKFGSKCVPVQWGGGQFATKQECIESGCEGLSPDKSKDIQQPFSPSPLTTTPQPKIAEPDDEFGTIEPEDEDEEEILRLQKLANITK